MLKKPYLYPKKRPVARPKVQNRVPKVAADEALTGIVQGQDASDIEERFARALYKANLEFTFRDHFFGPARNTPGAIEVDFMVSDGAAWSPIQIDGEIAHKTASQREGDRIKDSRLNAYFSRVGINHVKRVPDGVKYPINSLDTQDNTDRIVRELFK